MKAKLDTSKLALPKAGVDLTSSHMGMEIEVCCQNTAKHLLLHFSCTSAACNYTAAHRDWHTCTQRNCHTMTIPGQMPPGKTPGSDACSIQATPHGARAWSGLQSLLQLPLLLQLGPQVELVLAATALPVWQLRLWADPLHVCLDVC